MKFKRFFSRRSNVITPSSFPCNSLAILRFIVIGSRRVNDCTKREYFTLRLRKIEEETWKLEVLKHPRQKRGTIARNFLPQRRSIDPFDDHYRSWMLHPFTLMYPRGSTSIESVALCYSRVDARLFEFRLPIGELVDQDWKEVQILTLTKNNFAETSFETSLLISDSF